MTAFNQDIVFGVNRIQVHFVNTAGKNLRIQGTGFWIGEATGPCFVTNRHNIDPTLKLGANTDFRLVRVELELRHIDGQNPLKETRFFEVENLETALSMAGSADVAILYAPTMSGTALKFKPYPFVRRQHLADEAFFRSKVSIGDMASFIGFPGRSGKTWWDLDWNLPIARFCSVASYPKRPFKNDGISTTDTMLVAGLSFSGSSGSPLILHGRGVAPGGDIVDASYRPPTVLGIMSGHWMDPGEEQDMFKHTGLSYFTRATVISELLAQHF